MKRAICITVILALALLAVPQTGQARVKAPAPLPPAGMGILCYSFFPVGFSCFVFPIPAGTFYR